MRLIPIRMCCILLYFSATSGETSTNETFIISEDEKIVEPKVQSTKDTSYPPLPPSLSPDDYNDNETIPHDIIGEAMEGSNKTSIVSEEEEFVEPEVESTTDTSLPYPPPPPTLSPEGSNKTSIVGEEEEFVEPEVEWTTDTSLPHPPPPPTLSPEGSNKTSIVGEEEEFPTDTSLPQISSPSVPPLTDSPEGHGEEETLTLGTESATDEPRPYSPTTEYSVPEIPQPTCYGKTSCAGRCSTEREYQRPYALPEPSCFCDPQCNTVFHDCCGDYDQKCNASLMAERFPATELDGRWKCYSIFEKDHNFWMIGKCSPDWTEDDVSEKCTNAGKFPKASVELPVIDKNSTTFRNRYCALCNGVTEFTHWKFNVDCTVKMPADYTEPEWSAFLDNLCHRDSFRLDTNNRAIRHCYPVKKKCKYAHNKGAVKYCHSGPTGLISRGQGRNYKNAGCVFCNLPPNSDQPRASCGPILPLIFDGEWPGVLPFSEILSAPKFHRRTPTSQCPKDHIFDKASQICRKILSKQHFNREKVGKYSVILEYEEVDHSCCLSLRTVGREKTFLRFSDVFEKLLYISLVETGWKFSDLNVQILGNSRYGVTFQILAILDHSKSDSEFLLQYSKIDNITIDSGLEDIPERFRFCRYSLENRIVREMFCVGNETYASNKIEFFKNKTIVVNETGQYYSREQYLVFREENERKIAVCENFRPANCSYYLETKDEELWKMFPNRSVYANVTASWFHYGEYSIVNGTLWLCLTKNLLKNTKKFQGKSDLDHVNILSYLTLASLTLSILSLVVLLIVYLIHSQLRNVPGKNLMLLCTVLATGQFLWLLQRKVYSWSSTACVALSVALQYFFLSSFCCSGSFAFHSFVTFRSISKGKLSKPSSGKGFVRYAAYSLGFPLALVVVFWVLDFYQVVSIAYGGHGNCWFGSKFSLYVGFIGPMFALLFVNFLLLLTALRVIRKCTKESQKMAEDSGGPNRIHVGIFLRMSTLMGLTWVLGVFQLVFPDLLAFEYLFVLINGLQGVYITVAFLFTDSVKKLLSRRMSRGGNTSKTLSTARHKGTKTVS